MKLTYGEQLAHPNWQRVRLQMLNAANFECEICGDGESTLHVHHKQYIKGRMAWEYEAANFDVLCKWCHLDTHAAKDSISSTLAIVPSVFWPDAASILIGWAERDGESTNLTATDPHSEAVGRLAAVMSRALSLSDIESLQKSIESWLPTASDLDIKIEKHLSFCNDGIGVKHG